MMPTRSPGHPLPAGPAYAPGRRRPWAALGLAALVLWLHGLLIGALAPGLPQRAGPPAGAGPARPAPMQVSLQTRPAARPGAEAPVPADWPVPARPPQPRLAPRAAAPAVPVAGPQRLPASPASASDPIAGDAAADAAADPSPAPAAEPTGDPDAAPPPVYATRIPPPVQLRYTLRYNGQEGQALLAWRHDGRHYTLDLDGQGATQALVVQASRGGFDAAGLAPERFTDRRRGSRLQAANFRRDVGRIGFSGPALDHPAWPGAQDRLSWLAQLVAIRTAADAAPPGPPLSTVTLFVVDARGGGAMWHFRSAGEVALGSPSGPVATQLWRREPPRPEGLRVEAWLDAARGHWPVQLRFTALRSGDLFELRLIDEPASPP